MKKIIIGWIILLIAMMGLSLAACQSSTAGQPTQAMPATVGKLVKLQDGTYIDISVAELQGMLAKKDFKLINVHIPFEGNLPDTDLSIPYDQIDKNLAYLPADKNAKIVLYCRTGHMSTIAATTLVKLGYTNIWNLVGGMQAWEAAGLTINK
jgi:rhodanese-related sulfurtransferase